MPENLPEEEPLSSTGEQLEDHSQPNIIGKKNQRKGKAILRCYILFFAHFIVGVSH
jgi:hypothetical protein